MRAICLAEAVRSCPQTEFRPSAAEYRRPNRLALGFALGFLALGTAHAASNPCDPLTYGAVADGTTDNTVAIQMAIDNCAALGGGTVPFDHGVFLTGPFQLKDDIVLRVAAGATILATTDQTRYAAAFIGGDYMPGEALISSDNASDVGIIGGGTIDGQGDVAPPSAAQSWFGAGLSWYALASTAPFNSTPYASHPNAPSSNGLPRPWLIELWMTDHIVVQGVHLARSPMWTLVPRYATDVTIVGISDSAPSTSKNTDAVDVVSSDHVRISAVNFASGDDDVALKSGLPPPLQDTGASLPAAATQNVIVANAVYTSGHGMSIGSEAINGVNNIAIMNIAMSNTSNGFRIKTGRDRGSQIHDITATNLTMTNVAQPIVINSYYPASSPPACGSDTTPKPITSTTPFVHDITLRNVTATGSTSQSFIAGLAESYVLNVTLDNVTVGQASNKVKPMDLRWMTGNFSNVTVSPTTTGTNFTCLEGASGPGVQ